MSNMKNYLQERAERAANKRAIVAKFAPLLTLWIEEHAWDGVYVHFNGYGDSGEIESVSPYKLLAEKPDDKFSEVWEEGDAAVLLEDCRLDDPALFSQPLANDPILQQEDAALGDGDEPPIVTRCAALAAQDEEFDEAINRRSIEDMFVWLAELALDAAGHGGWECDEGSYGNVMFTSGGRVITDIYTRYSAACRTPIAVEPEGLIQLDDRLRPQKVSAS